MALCVSLLECGHSFGDYQSIINGILAEYPSRAEAMYSITEKDIRDLEKIEGNLEKKN